MILLAQSVQAKQRDSGFYINKMTTCNCVVNMISPEAYKEFVFPYDHKIAESFERFGVHTCNWDVTPYIDVLEKLPKLGYIDMGMMSDMLRVRKTFPNTRRAVLYSPVTLQNASHDKIREDITKIYTDLGPCDLIMADIQEITVDSRVNELVSICRSLENG
jgi:hypothetical protein